MSFRAARQPRSSLTVRIASPATRSISVSYFSISASPFSPPASGCCFCSCRCSSSCSAAWWSAKRPISMQNSARSTGNTKRTCRAGCEPASNIQHLGRRELCTLLNEFEAGFRLIAHQLIHDLVGQGPLTFHDLDFQQRTERRVHRRLLQLPHRHLAETFEARDVHFALAVELLLHQLLLMRIVARKKRLAALAQAIERRHGEIQMSLIDQPPHLLIEEGDQERGDMRAVDIGVGHDHHLLVAEILIAILRTGAATERLNEVGQKLIVAELR